MKTETKTVKSKGKKYNCVINGVPYYKKSKTINGKRMQFYGDGMNDCLRKIEEAEAAARAGVDYSLRKAKTGDVFQNWLYNIKRNDSKLKASSFARYDSAYRNHIKPYPICDTVLSSLTSATMQGYVTSLYEDHGLSGSAVKETVKVWKMFCAWALEEGYYVKNPCRNLVVPGERKRKVIETFTAEERMMILDYMEESDYEYKELIRLAFETGMRQGELLSMKWSDIKDKGIYIERSTAMATHVDKEGNRERYREVWDTKTLNSTRFMPLRDSTLEMLNIYSRKKKAACLAAKIPYSIYVFTTSKGNMIDATSLVKSYTRMLKRAGVPHRKFHAIRHTFATEAARQGMNIKDLQMLMGHSDVDTTLIYVQASNDSKRRAIEAMPELMGSSI